MNYKRAVGLGILSYFVAMILGMIACSAMGITPDITQPISTEMWLATATFSILSSVGATYLYFRGKNLVPSLKAGLRFGAVVLVSGIVLDILFFLSLSFEGFNPLDAMMMYYGQPAFWLTMALVLAGCGAMGAWLEKKGKK